MNAAAKRVALAVTVGDPGGDYLPGLRRLSTAVTDVFADIGPVVMTTTHTEVMSFLRERMGARIATEEPNGEVGRHRRRSVELALGFRPDAVLHSDIDHLLRGIEAGGPELRAACRWLAISSSSVAPRRRCRRRPAGCGRRSGS